MDPRESRKRKINCVGNHWLFHGDSGTTSTSSHGSEPFVQSAPTLQQPNRDQVPAIHHQRMASTIIYTSGRGPVNDKPMRAVGSIHDLDPVNDYHGSLNEHAMYPGALGYNPPPPLSPLRSPKLSGNKVCQPGSQQYNAYHRPPPTSSYYPDNQAARSRDPRLNMELREHGLVRDHHMQIGPNGREPTANYFPPPPYPDLVQASVAPQMVHHNHPQYAAAQRTSGRVYKAIYDYVAQDVDEISFKEGDLIVNCTHLDEGWLSGTLQRTGVTGMLPANHVIPAI